MLFEGAFDATGAGLAVVVAGWERETAAGVVSRALRLGAIVKSGIPGDWRFAAEGLSTSSNLQLDEATKASCQPLGRGVKTLIMTHPGPLERHAEGLWSQFC